jgi:hypothetical protein
MLRQVVNRAKAAAAPERRSEDEARSFHLGLSVARA